MKDHLKAIVVVFIILITYTILVYVYAKSKNSKTNEKESKDKTVEKDKKPEETSKIDDITVIITPNTYLGYGQGKWHELDKYDYENKYFDVYTGTTNTNKKLVYSDSWYIMNEDRTFIDYNDGFVAVLAQIPYTYSQATEVALTNAHAQIIKEFLDKENVKYNYNTLRKHVYNFDVNHDGLKDDVYVISNLFLDDYTGFDKTYAYVFVRTLNQNVLLYEKSFDDVNALSICNPNVLGFFTIDDNPLILMNCSYFSAGGTKHILFDIDEKTAKLVLESKSK